MNHFLMKTNLFKISIILLINKKTRTFKMNRGGFSWRRFFGVSAFKARISRQIGIPLTQSGRQRKIGALVERLILSLFSR